MSELLDDAFFADLEMRDARASLLLLSESKFVKKIGKRITTLRLKAAPNKKKTVFKVKGYCAEWLDTVFLETATLIFYFSNWT